jgi:hypothetical protein
MKELVSSQKSVTHRSSQLSVLFLYQHLLQRKRLFMLEMIIAVRPRSVCSYFKLMSVFDLMSSHLFHICHNRRGKHVPGIPGLARGRSEIHCKKVRQRAESRWEREQMESTPPGISSLQQSLPSDTMCKWSLVDCRQDASLILS